MDSVGVSYTAATGAEVDVGGIESVEAIREETLFAGGVLVEEGVDEERENQDDHEEGFGVGSAGGTAGCCVGAGVGRDGACSAGLLLLPPPPISAWIRARNFVISGSASGSACGVELAGCGGGDCTGICDEGSAGAWLAHNQPILTLSSPVGSALDAIRTSDIVNQVDFGTDLSDLTFGEG